MIMKHCRNFNPWQDLICIMHHVKHKGLNSHGRPGREGLGQSALQCSLLVPKRNQRNVSWKPTAQFRQDGNLPSSPAPDFHSSTLWEPQTFLALGHISNPVFKRNTYGAPPSWTYACLKSMLTWIDLTMVCAICFRRTGMQINKKTYF